MDKERKFKLTKKSITRTGIVALALAATFSLTKCHGDYGLGAVPIIYDHEHDLDLDHDHDSEAPEEPTKVEETKEEDVSEIGDDALEESTLETETKTSTLENKVEEPVQEESIDIENKAPVPSDSTPEETPDETPGENSDDKSDEKPNDEHKHKWKVVDIIYTSNSDGTHTKITLLKCDGHSKKEVKVENCHMNEWTSLGEKGEGSNCELCGYEQTRNHDLESVVVNVTDNGNDTHKVEKKDVCTTCDYETAIETSVEDCEYGEWYSLGETGEARDCEVCDHDDTRDHTIQQAAQYIPNEDGTHIVLVSGACATCTYKLDTTTFQDDCHYTIDWTSKGSKGEARECDECHYEETRDHDLKIKTSEVMNNGNGTHTYVTDYECDTCDYETEKINDTENCKFGSWTSLGEDGEGRECEVCDYEETRGHDLQVVSSEVKDNGNGTHTYVTEYDCGTCDYEPAIVKNTVDCEYTNWTFLNEEKELGECEVCGHEGTRDHDLQIVKSKVVSNEDGTHSYVIDYECDTCTYETTTEEKSENCQYTWKFLNEEEELGECKVCGDKDTREHSMIDTIWPATYYKDGKHAIETKHECGTCDYEAESTIDYKECTYSDSEWKSNGPEGEINNCEVCHHKGERNHTPGEIKTRYEGHGDGTHTKIEEQNCTTCDYVYPLETKDEPCNLEGEKKTDLDAKTVYVTCPECHTATTIHTHVLDTDYEPGDDCCIEVTKCTDENCPTEFEQRIPLDHIWSDVDSVGSMVYQVCARGCGADRLITKGSNLQLDIEEVTSETNFVEESIENGYENDYTEEEQQEVVQEEFVEEVADEVSEYESVEEEIIDYYEEPVQDEEEMATQDVYYIEEDRPKVFVYTASY